MTVYITREMRFGVLEAHVLSRIGRAVELHPVELHAFCAAPDRFDLVMTAPTKQRRDAFLGQLWKMKTGLGEPAFRGRARISGIAHRAIARLRMKQALARPLELGLVERAEYWLTLGATSAWTLCGDPLHATWRGRVIEIPIAPLPERLGGAIDGHSLFDEIYADQLVRTEKSRTATTSLAPRSTRKLRPEPMRPSKASRYQTSRVQRG